LVFVDGVEDVALHGHAGQFRSQTADLHLLGGYFGLVTGTGE
jgi:hypothetical protein